MRIDRFLQRQFDRPFIALMERGVPKGLIRWYLLGVFTLCGVVSLAPWVWRGWMHLLTSTVLSLLYISAYGTAMHLNAEADRSVEHRPWMRSAADSPFHAVSLKAVGVFLFCSPTTNLITWLITSVWPGTVGWWADAAQASQGACAIAAGYLCGTPPTRPKPRPEPAAAAVAA